MQGGMQRRGRRSEQAGGASKMLGGDGVRRVETQGGKAIAVYVLGAGRGRERDQVAKTQLEWGQHISLMR